MIRIDKSATPVPAVLQNEGEDKKQEHIDAYEAAPAGYALNTRARTKFVFDNEIYGHTDVKVTLKSLQGNKCCFCEAKVAHISHGDIEHFRPKAAWKQTEGTTISYPGYYWLAYEWSNIYFACEVCNQREKGNFFPLVETLNRATPTVRNIENEEPYFIDPGGEDDLDPENHIYFIGEIPTHLSTKGSVTIEYLGLDRKELNDHREVALDRVKTLEDVVKLTADSANAEEARDKFYGQLRKSVQPDAEYSSMYKSNFNSYLKEL